MEINNPQVLIEVTKAFDRYQPSSEMKPPVAASPSSSALAVRPI